MREWREDFGAEFVLNMVNVEITKQIVNLSDIDWNESAHNCARMRNPLNEEKIEEYESAFRAGDIFPMVVLETQGQGKYCILGGNQRCNALKRLGGSLDLLAYVVKPLTTSEREAIIRSLNSRHGWGTEKSERIDHAVYLVREHGLAASDVARLMMVSDVCIQQRIRCEDARAALAKSGINSNSFSQGVLEVAARLKDTSIQSEFGRIVEKYNPTVEQSNVIAKAINASTSTAAKIKALKTWSSDLESSTHLNGRKDSKAIRTPRREKFFGNLNKLLEFLEQGNDGKAFTELDELQCSETRDGDKVRVLVRKVCSRLNLIVGVNHGS